MTDYSLNAQPIPQGDNSINTIPSTRKPTQDNLSTGVSQKHTVSHQTESSFSADVFESNHYNEAASTPHLSENHRVRSFLKVPIEIALDQLLSKYTELMSNPEVTHKDLEQFEESFKEFESTHLETIKKDEDLMLQYITTKAYTHVTTPEIVLGKMCEEAGMPQSESTVAETTTEKSNPEIEIKYASRLLHDFNEKFDQVTNKHDLQEQFLTLTNREWFKSAKGNSGEIQAGYESLLEKFSQTKEQAEVEKAPMDSQAVKSQILANAVILTNPSEG